MCCTGHGAKGGAFVRLVGSQLRVSRSCVARLYSPHGGSLHYNERTLRGQAYFAIERLLERWTDNLVFVSDYERRTYTDKIGEPHAPWRLIHNGLREHEFEPVGTAADAADFLYIGMMRDLKGPDVFIEALRRAEQLAGRPLRGRHGRRWGRQAALSGASGRARNGRQGRHARGVTARQAGLRHGGAPWSFPPRAESMPYLVLEAVAAGKPVISTRVGGQFHEILRAPELRRLCPSRRRRSGLPARCPRTSCSLTGWPPPMPDMDRFRSPLLRPHHGRAHGVALPRTAWPGRCGTHHHAPRCQAFLRVHVISPWPVVRS